MSLVGILHHEIWLDEGHHWLLARDSNSLVDLIHNTRYEGHPILWNILLYIISRFTSNPFWMQFLHILISTSVIVIFLRKAPFSILFKTLFIFGYFMLFEYNLLSRNYMIGVLFIFLACTFYKYKKERFILFSIFLSLAANTHVIFLIIASSIMFIELIEFLKFKKIKFNLIYSIGWSIFTIGIILALIQIIPPSDTTYFSRITDVPFSEKFTFGILSLFKGLITVPDFTSIHFWNSNLFINLSKPISSIFIILIYLLPLFLFYRNKVLILYAYVGIIAANIFFYITQLTSLRYDGMLFILIITGLWIDHYYNYEPNKLNLFIQQRTLDKIKKTAIYTILIIQLISGISSYTLDILFPFDNSKNVASFLKENDLLNKEIVTISCEGTPLSAYLKKKIYFLCANDYQSYCSWSTTCKMDNDLKYELDNSLTNFVNSTSEKIIFISNHPLYNNDHMNVKSNKFVSRLLKKFEGSILKVNDYYIYEISAN
jgi:hypothetical protein